MAIKICHLISSLDLGGAELSLLQLLSTADKSRFEFSVTCLTQPGAVAEHIQQLGIPVNSLGMERGHLSAVPLFRLAKQLKQRQIQILMTWLYHSDLLGLLAGKLAGVPAIIWNLRAAEMDMSRYPRLSGWTRWSCSRLSQLPDAVVANSMAGKTFHISIGYRPRNWIVIRNGIDAGVFRPDQVAREQVRRELKIEPHEVVVAMVARFDPMKDFDNFLAAARIVAGRCKSARFVLAGKGVVAENPSLSAALNDPILTGRVQLLGEREDVPRLMTAFDIACSSSLSEGFPNVIAEAMASGLVCVATNVGESGEIINGHGILVPPADSDSLSQALLQALEMNPSERQAVGGAAREHIVRNFTSERVTIQYESLFSQMAKGIRTN